MAAAHARHFERHASLPGSHAGICCSLDPGVHRLEDSADAVQNGEGLLVAAHELEANELILYNVAVGVGQRGQRPVAQVHGGSDGQVLEAHLHCGHIQP